MKRHRIAIVVSVALLVLAQAAPLVANSKGLTCEQLADGLQGRGDLGTDYGSILLGVVGTAHPRMCVPNGTMLGTLRAVFLHWADNHPEAMTSEGWSCAARAFRESFLLEAMRAQVHCSDGAG